MIELNRHIEILLLGNDCVIVPGLGGFMAHHVDARYDGQDGMFVPPLRTLGFNPLLKMNDSLLVQSYIEAYDISYPEALRRIESEVAELRSHLETEGSYELNDIGLLSLNEEGNLQFEPCEAGVLTPELYGLSSFEMTPLKSRPSSDESAPKKRPSVPEENAITIKMSWLRNAAAVAAATLAFLMIGTPVSNSDKVPETQQSSFFNMPSRYKSAVHQTVGKTPDAKEGNNETATQGETQDGIQVKTFEGSFCIVMASQVTERNANAFIGQMEEQGFTEARILVSGSKNIRRVVYGSYESEAAAASMLKELRGQAKMFASAWVMEIK